jgi:hypothetical protein
MHIQMISSGRVESAISRPCPTLPARRDSFNMPMEFGETAGRFATAPTQRLRSGRLSPPALLLAASAAAAGLLPCSAWAHVKWFAPYDVATAPASVATVLSNHFLLILLGFIVLVSGTFLLDRLAETKIRTMAAPGGREDIEEQLLRAGTGAFFVALFAIGGVILTPELKTGAEWPAWLQLGIAVSMLSARTCVAGSIGILVLYGYGIGLYGIFHLSDYPMFIGLAAYLALTSFKSERLRLHRMPILQLSICISLMWGAVEKWAYPQWTFPILAERPYLTFGLAPEDFMVVAGFVEFTFAFYMLTGFGLLRLSILGLSTIFAAAIVDFGKVDAIGHLPILVPLIAMFLHGPTKFNLWFRDASESVLRRARTAGAGLATAVFVFFAAYYGIQYAEYGYASHSQYFSLLASALHVN